MLLHLRNITSGHFLDPNTAAVRSNPDAAAGHSGSVELPQPAPGDAPPSSCSDDDIDVASVDGVAFDEPDPLPAVPSASASISFLTWQDIHDACHGFASAADGYCAHFRSHAAFTLKAKLPSSSLSSHRKEKYQTKRQTFGSLQLQKALVCYQFCAFTYTMLCSRLACLKQNVE